jgi:hypothetical protein
MKTTECSRIFGWGSTAQRIEAGQVNPEAKPITTPQLKLGWGSFKIAEAIFTKPSFFRPTIKL